MKRNILLLLAIFSLNSYLFSQTHIDQNGIQTSVVGNLSASATQARRFEVARIGYNSHHWQNGGTIIVELFEYRFAAGYEKYFVQIGYHDGTDATLPKIFLVESSGSMHYAKISLGEPTDLSTSAGGYVNKVIPLYVDVRYYANYKVKLTYLRTRVSNVTDMSQIQINESPAPADISDFTVSTTLEGNLYSSGNLRVTGSGNHYISGGPVGIGTTNPATDAALTVGGMIRAREVKITTDAGADFVFDKAYDLKTIHEVENFISKNRHLPDIPSEEEMINNGIGMKEMQLKLLQKIEELTLYIIEQNKRIEDQNKRIQELEKILQKNKLR